MIPATFRFSQLHKNAYNIILTYILEIWLFLLNNTVSFDFSHYAMPNRYYMYVRIINKHSNV